MIKSRTILFGLLIILVVALIVCGCSHKKREGYADVFYNKGLDENTLTRSTFTSNLDPRNMNLRSDPYAYGGYIKGASPDKENLASYNKVASYRNAPQREGFDAVPSTGTVYGGMNDALSYVEYIDSDYDGLPGNAQSDGSGVSDYGVIDSDFAHLASDGTFQSTRMASAAQKYKASLSNKNPDTLKYTTPQELLPAPDMRQPLARDMSDPSVFMYTRTLFAPLKKRNHNEADRIRGDLDIEPIKIGHFDVATVPEVDLVKGYFGYYNDIQQYQDIQDIAYIRNVRDQTGQDSSSATQKLTAALTAINQDASKLSLKYATPPRLDFGSLNSSYSNDNAWYNTLTGSVSNQQFKL